MTKHPELFQEDLKKPTPKALLKESENLLKTYGLGQVMIISVLPDGRIISTSWGKTMQKCRQAGRWLDKICAYFESTCSMED